MINRIKELFSVKAEQTETGHSDEELHLAAAALLVEAACMDGNFDDDERASITGILKDRFELSSDETETIITEAEQAVEHSGQLYAFTRVIKDRYSDEERIGMLEMLWEVAFADGNVDHFEDNLIRRVAGLIFISDRDRGIARKKVMARLGIT